MPPEITVQRHDRVGDHVLRHAKHRQGFAQPVDHLAHRQLRSTGNRVVNHRVGREHRVEKPELFRVDRTRVEVEGLRDLVAIRGMRARNPASRRRIVKQAPA